MKLTWTQRAIADLNEACTYIALDSPYAARRVAARVFQGASLLVTMPGMGRSGSLPGTREPMIGSTPYFLVCRVRQDELQIMLVRHTSQEWPDSGVEWSEE